MKIPRHSQLACLFFLLCVLIIGCSSNRSASDNNLSTSSINDAGLQQAVQSAFDLKIQYFPAPYRNEQFFLLSNDGTFADVQIIAELRLDRDTNWTEYVGSVECSKIGNQWDCSYFDWELSPNTIATREQATQSIERAKNEEAETVKSQLSGELVDFEPSIIYPNSYLVWVKFTNNSEKTLRLCIEATVYGPDELLWYGRYSCDNVGILELAPGASQTVDFQASNRNIENIPRSDVEQVCIGTRWISYPSEYSRQGSTNMITENIVYDRLHEDQVCQ